jgi:hypothetical protein
VRRSSKVKRNTSARGSPRRRLVAVEDSTDDRDDEEDLQSLRSPRLKTARRKLSNASLSEEDLHSMSMRSAKARMERRNVSSASLRVQETDDRGDCTDTDDEDDYSPSPSRKSSKVKRKPQTSSSLGTLPRNVDDSMVQFQGGLGRSESSSQSRSGSGQSLLSDVWFFLT